MSKITNKELVEKAKVLLSRSDVQFYYWPYNPGDITNQKEFCYYNGLKLLVSPAGLVKSIIYNSTMVNNKSQGKYAVYNSSVTKIDPSIEAYAMVTKYSSEVSNDFRNIPYGAILTKGTTDKACGIYIGNGKVIEVTDNWSANTIITSDISTTGSRTYKSVASGSWTKWGKLNDINYAYQPAEDAEKSVSENSDGETVVTYSGDVVGTSKYSPSSFYNYMVYDGSESTEINVRPVYDALNLTSTVINAGNKYYIADKTGVDWNDSRAIYNRHIKDGDNYISEKYYNECPKAKALDALTYNGEYRSRLANCVGYARGRVFELWGQLLDNKIIVESNNKLIVPTLNNLELSGDIYISHKRTGPGTSHIPASDAGKFSTCWPATVGFGIGNEPKVGSIICWTKENAKGHVAFVEAIENRGQSDEYIIVSASGYSKKGAKSVAWMQKVQKYSSYGFYSCGEDYVFSAFCYTPLCQIFGDNTTSALTKSTIVIDWEEVTAQDIEDMVNLNSALSNTRVTSELKVGDKVRVEWFGYKTASADENDKKQRINISGAEGYVKKIESDKPFKYAITTDGETICGYFNRKALALLE